MTGKERHEQDDRLARLYREQGDIEPGPGVDQRIRARARAETESSRLPRPRHWLGGIAAAASLFIVVSVVTRIQPPQAELPPTSPEQAPAVGGDRAEAPTASRQHERPVDDQTAVAPPPQPEPERRTRAMRRDNESLSESSLSQDRSLKESAAFSDAGDDDIDPVDPQATDIDQSLWLLDRLISVGQAERARAEVEAFREQFPEQEIPRKLLERLEELEAGDVDRE